MDLVPVYKSKSQGDQANQTGNADAIPSLSSKPSAQPASHEFDVPVERQQQFGVTYAQAKRERLVRTVRTVGLVTADKGRQWMYVPRTDGYVQKLYITSPGQVVEKGQDLMQVYSPDLAGGALFVGGRLLDVVPAPLQYERCGVGWIDRACRPGCRNGRGDVALP